MMYSFKSSMLAVAVQVFRAAIWCKVWMETGEGGGGGGQGVLRGSCGASTVKMSPFGSILL